MSETRGRAGCGYAFLAAVVGFGLALVVLGNGPSASEPTVRRVLTGVGMFVTVAGALFWIPMQRALRGQQTRARLEAEFPDQPWKWRPEWNTGRIEAAGGGGTVALWCFALFWNALSWTAVLAAWRQPAGGEKALWLILIFPAIGLLLGWAASYRTVQARKFGRPVFLPTSVPGVIGGYLGGVIHAPKTLPPLQSLKLTLQALRTTVRRSGKNRSVQTDVLWEHEVEVDASQLAAGSAGSDIPVLFHVPSGLPDSELTTTDPRTYWRLRARADVPGVDFETAFEVPMFATGEIASPPESGRPLRPEYRDETATPRALAEAGISVGEDPGSGHPVFRFSTRHLAGTRIFFTGLALAATTGALTLGWQGLWVPAFFAGFFDLFFVLGAYALWTGATELVVAPETLIVRSRTLGGWKEQPVPRDAVARVRMDKSLKSGEQQYFRLVLEGVAGSAAPPAGVPEPFARRKARYQLGLALKKASRSGADAARVETLLAQAREAPAFALTAASHVPGPALAERVARMLEQRIQAKPRSG